MLLPIIKKFQSLLFTARILTLVVSGLVCQNLWAIQDAIVLAEQAVVFADEQMTSPVGFIRRGKKIKIGENARNNSRVYPLLVSGKIAFIKVADVSTEKDSVDAPYLVAERFLRSTENPHKTRYGISYFHYSTQTNLIAEKEISQVQDGLNWQGLAIRGEVLVRPRWNLQVLVNFLNGAAQETSFLMTELGLGAMYTLADIGKFQLRLGAQILGVPFASFEISNMFRKNGYGVSSGAGVELSYKFKERWLLDGQAGIYYTRLSGFALPQPFPTDVAFSFIGTRAGLGVSYQY
jgi:hypothetical protein